MAAVRIGIGFGIFPFGLPSPETICAYVDRAEDLGIDSVWLSDHIVSRRPSLDIACVMAMFAARTKRIKMGPSVLTLPARNPVEVAKTYASLDHLTGGRRRVIMAVGLGSDPRDCIACGIKPEERVARLEEGVTVLRKLWTEEHVTHHGRFYSFEDVTIEPRPVGGALDIWIGGRTTAALRRTAQYGDGWFPSFISPEQFSDGMQRVTAMAHEQGRTIDAGEAGVVLLAHVTDDRREADAVTQQVAMALNAPPEAMASRAAIGSADECVERLNAYVAAGCTKFVLFPLGAAEQLVPQIEAYGRHIVPRFA
jgi:probable F420-dependent oxidoreductase